MKRILILILVPVFALLTSCRSSYFLDAQLFCNLINEKSDIYKFQIKNAVIKNEGDEISFSFFIDSANYLVKLYSESEDLNLKHCSLTSLNSKAKDNQKFLKIAENIISVFSRDDDSAEEIIKSLNMNSSENTYPRYFETDFFRYSYQKNKFGACFTIENKSLTECPDTELTLRH